MLLFVQYYVISLLIHKLWLLTIVNMQLLYMVSLGGIISIMQ